jgi:hypothetical protein
MPLIRRARGRLLRLVLDRRVAVAAGILLVSPALWLMMTEHSWEGALTDGAALIASATGVALIVAGLGGRRGDWYDAG